MKYKLGGKAFGKKDMSKLTRELRNAPDALADTRWVPPGCFHCYPDGRDILTIEEYVYSPKKKVKRKGVA